jgi:ABC-2 type transport system permease protein
MTYAYDALSRVASEPNPSGRVALDAAVLVAAAILALCLGAATLRRRTG